MQEIRYRRHVLMLIPAAILLWLFNKAGDGTSDVGFLLPFGAMGSLHASSVVISLRDRSAVTIGKAISFVTLVGALSILTIFSPLLLVPVLSVQKTPTLDTDLRFLLVLGAGSAFGASGYWLLLRLFWFKSRSLLTLITTVVLCSTATVLSWLGAGRLMQSIPSIAELIPTLGWWAAFTFSLYCSDLEWRPDKSTPTPRQNGLL